ncbi:hypothetical protein U9M48_037711 [Paspalum notatum var. saurae]|uniref:DUF4216 domain-containing protein n=1 Tax=Paspalum notatum var. saurae TaxID=547442 RepID=A0AAQ3UFL2_PASNO
MLEDNEDDEEEFHNVDYAEHPFFADTMMGDGEDVEDTDALGAMLQAAEKYCDNENVRKKLERMMEDHKTTLYFDCKGGHKKLRSTLELLQWKATNGISDKAFTQLLKLIKEFLPEGNKLPETTYEAKEVVCPIGLEVQKIHSCPNDCILYCGKELEDLEACPVCKASRYKIRRNDSGDVEGEPPRKRIPAKVMWYFPIIPRLKRLFQNKEHAKMVRWHKEDRKEDDMLRHPADGSQWRKVDRMYSQFAEDARNIWFGLSTDGMNPFSEMSSSHSTWPVTLCMYNIPPWLCLKRKFIMMPALTQGLKQPGNHIDVYLQPLVEELLELWSTGVRMWDEYKQEDFDLLAMLFVTINDRPALSNLSGQSNKGFRAYTHCLDDTDRRLAGKGTLGRKVIRTNDNSSFDKAHTTVLQHSSMVAPHIEEHKMLLAAQHPGKSEAWITHIVTYQGYEINGYTFYTRAQDRKSTNQNSGVRIDAIDNDGNKDTYYGCNEEIWELEYGPYMSIPLFRCQWVKLNRAVMVDPDYGMTTVNLDNIEYRDEPFVLAKDTAQVFYVKDMSTIPRKRLSKNNDQSCGEPRRHIVLLGKRKIMGIDEVNDEEDYNKLDDIPPFSVPVDTSLLLASQEAPYLCSDHNEGTLVKRKYMTVPI